MTTKKKIVVLGSTGSIGTNALRVLQHLSHQWEVVGLACGHNTKILSEQAAFWKPQWVYTENASQLQSGEIPSKCQVLSDSAILAEKCAAPEVDMVLCAIVGTAGFQPVLQAIHAGKDIALASKEILVMAGELVTEECRKSGSKLLPVDSEHCAIFQCLDQHPNSSVEKIILTASGGPFRTRKEPFSTITLEETLKHPTWNMGRKITIDCATMMNKGLEMIEARWLFNMPAEKIDVVVHPQSIVHSMVQFVDGAVLAQLGVPDMALPIHYCLCYPSRQSSITPAIDFTQPHVLTFEPPDLTRFPALRLAREALLTGKTAGTVFNASNEVAVEAFIQHKIHFDQIPALVEKTLSQCPLLPADSLENILFCDQKARRIAHSLI